MVPHVQIGTQGTYLGNVNNFLKHDLDFINSQFSEFEHVTIIGNKFGNNLFALHQGQRI